jgi:rfaE bifunctional protein kinase chain/domain
MELELLNEMVARASDVRVAVVGDLMLDIYLVGSVNRISPEAPVPVVRVAEESSALGGAANVAANVARIGAKCDLIGVVGHDGAGDRLVESIAALGEDSVRPRVVRTGDRPTTTKTRVMARHQQIVRYDRERDDDLPAPVAAEIRAQIEAAAAEADILVLEDYDKGVLTPEVIRSALDAAEAHGIPVVVDPKFRHALRYGGATVFKPNVLELSSALGTPARMHDDGWLEEARARFGCTHLLVTCGEDGMVLKSEGSPSIRIPAVAREVYDVSGAGDTVTAFVAVALATGASMIEAATLANLAAAIEVGKPGVATVHPDEIRERLAATPAAALL